MIKQNRKNLRLAILSIIWAGLFVFLNFSVAQAQNEIDITAYITDKNNIEVQNGEYQVKFSIYNSADSGQAVWEETQTVKIQDGILNAYLSTVVPLPASFFVDTSEYYLGIKIGTDSEMAPRQKMGAVPMAINASFLNGEKIGKKKGDILQLGKDGKIDVKMLPSITTLGTISTGTWEGDVITAQVGGTGISSYAVGDLLYASSTSALATLAKGTNGQVLALVNGLPAWASMVEFSENVSNDDDALVIADSNDDGVGDIFLKISDSNKMVVLNNGNVGIGTDTPAYKLDVNGTINATSLIINGEATLGTAGENITFNSSLIPSTTGLNLGSSSAHWSNLYVDNLSVGGTDMNGTTSEYFSINTDSLAEETMGLRFYRSELNGYSALVWDSSASQFKLYKRENTSELGDISLGIIKGGTWNGSLITPSYLASNVIIEGENVSLLNNDALYISDGNTSWDNSYGFITASSSETLTNKTWNGSAIGDAYISSAATWNAKQDALGYTPLDIAGSNAMGANLQLAGYTLLGNSTSGGNLTLSSTSNATKGKIIFGTSVYDEVNNRLGIGTTTPGWLLDVNGSASINNNLLAQLEGGTYYGRTKVTENQWTVGDDRGVTWVARDSNREWHNIAISSDGKYQTAVVIDGQIYTSTDYGVTWIARDSNRTWLGIAMSSDGKYQTAVVQSGQIYTSTDYGVTWTARDSSRVWHSIAMSSDGKHQTAGVGGGQIYTSTDYGVNWTARDSSRWWGTIAMSSDGKYQSSAVQDGQIYTSTDYGVTWTARDSNRTWLGIAMSSDGKYQTAVVYLGQIYTSTDYGVTWTARNSNRDWRGGIAISSDGKYQTAVVTGGQIYTSTDYGVTWTARDSNRNWRDVAMSSDGKYQTATNNAGRIYTSYASSNMIGSSVGIGDSTPTSLLTVGNGDLFQVNSSGQIAAVAGYTQGSGNFSISGTGTFGTGTGTISLNGATTLAANQNFTMNSGTGQFSQTYTGTTTNAASIIANSLTTGSAISLSSTSLTSGNLASLVVNGTGAASNTQTGLNISMTGANTTTTQTTYGLYTTNIHTGTLSTNVGGYFSASGGTNNYGLLVANGNVGIGTTTPGWLLDVNGPASINNNLLAQLEGGTFYGRTKVTENQWAVGDDRGVTWSAKDSSRNWFGIAMSSDGKYQTAVVYNTGYIYTSTDYGATWTARDSSRAWRDVAMSSDGKYQTAVVFSGQIYTSTDYGITWTARDSSRVWRGIAMSSDGKYQTAVASGAQIYTSADYGITWTARSSSLGWYNVAMSSDGKYQTATIANGQIYTSADYGITWTGRDSSRMWLGIAISSDGKYQTAVVNGGQIYISINYGANWTAKDSSRNWTDVAMSSDGKYQTAVVDGGQIYTSTDYGATWIARDSSRVWYGVAMSSDGKYQTATVYGGQIYTSYASSYMAGGNVGINTSLPIATFHLVGAAGTVGLELNSNETTAGNNIMMLRSDVAGADDAVFRVQADGAVFADGAYTGTGADYAEYFATKDKDLQAGEVVCVDTQKENAIKRCVRSGDNDVMGIVSSKPSIVGNSSDGREKDENYKIIGMMGQVSGKVSNENGEIQIGDNLTSAIIPGYMRKANAGESTVGVALQNFNNNQGSIQILISRKNKSLTVEQVEEETAKRIAEMKIEDEVALLVNNQLTNYSQLLSDTTLSMTGIKSETILLAERVDRLEKNILDLDVNNQLSILTNIQDQIDLIKITNDAVLEFFEIINPETLVLKDFDGNINLLDGKLEAEGIVAGAFTVKENSADSPTIGEGLIKKGESEALIESKAVVDGSRVFVTVEMNKDNTEIPNQLLVVAEIVSGKSFKVMAKEPVSENTEFSWWIVNMQAK